MESDLNCLDELSIRFQEIGKTGVVLDKKMIILLYIYITFYLLRVGLK
jgi:hypothetical protein